MRKVVAVTHGGEQGYADLRFPPGLVALSVHHPAADAPAAQPDDVREIWMLWLDDGADPLRVTADVLHGAPITAYLVDERVQWDYERDWPVGDDSPGVKQLSFVRRLPSITRAEFATHWDDVHAPLARVHHPGIWRYAQNVVVETLTPDAPDLDGVAELHFRTYDDLRYRMYDSEEGKEAIRADVRNFIDVPAGWRMLSTERILGVPDRPDQDPQPPGR